MAELSPEHQLFISQAVKAGIYPSPQAALEEAVSLLQVRDRLRSDIQAGIDQVQNGDFAEAQDVFGRLEQRLSELESGSDSTA